MGARFTFLSEAHWLNGERAIGYAWIFLILFAIASLAWIGLSPHLIDPEGKPLGTDFMDVWAAGKLALAGEPAAAYDYARHYAIERNALPYPAGSAAPYYGWHYPPLFLLIAAPLALLPYGAALAAWMAATLPAYLAAAKQAMPVRRWWVFALAFPAVFVNLGHGQNAFLTTALLGCGLILLTGRPWLAGVLFGLLAYKPQFAVLIPIALIAGGHWRPLVSGTMTVCVAAAISAAVFGEETWRAFFASLHLTQAYVLEQGATGWEKIQSTFSAVRMWGGAIDLAYIVQGAVSLAATAVTVLVWRSRATMPIKSAALCVALLMATPYVLDYDLVVLALPMAWLAAEGVRVGFLPWEKIALGAAWLLPLVSRAVGMIGVPLGPFVLALCLAIIVRRALTPGHATADMSDADPVTRALAFWTRARPCDAANALPQTCWRL